MSQSPDPPPEEPERPSSRSALFAVYPSIMLPMFLALVDQTIVAAALPAIAAELGDVDRISWVVIGYLVAATIAAPVYGRLGDLLGRKRMMVVALVVFMSASILCAFAFSVPMLAVSRILQGLGGGGIMALSQALIGEAVPPRERARYQGLLAAVAVTASTFGAVAGGLLTQHLGWRSIFFVPAPVGLLAFLLLGRLQAKPGSGQPFRFDFAGLLLFAIFIASALVMLNLIQRSGTGAVVLLAMAAAAAVALILFIRREKRASHPLIPLTVLAHPAIWRSDALAACHGASLVSLVTFLPFYLRVVHGADAGTIGLLILPIAVSVAAGSMATGWLVSRTGRTAIFPSIGLLPVTAIFVGVAILAPVLSATQMTVILSCAALLLGTVMAVVQVTVQASAGPGMLGSAAASVQFSRSLGAALGTAIVGTVLFSFVALADAEAARMLAAMLEAGPEVLDTLAPARRAVVAGEIADAFRAAFFTLAVFTGAAATIAWSIPMRRL